MIALDTNVLVRVLTHDDPGQVSKALRKMRGHEIWLAKTVLLETEWVLRYSYGLSRSAVCGAMERLLGYGLAVFEDRETVLLALAGYQAGLDFADALHLASASETDRFLTFDRDLVRRAPSMNGVPKVEAV
jgi:predicted nucleic-acid-binding protein